MNTQASGIRWEFWIRWMVATTIGWIGGIFAAIILSYLVINLVYPKETNLIVGVCLGGAVALSQRFAVRRQLSLKFAWVWGAMVGIGIPFVAEVLLDELGSGAGEVWWLLLVVGGVVCGLIQASALRPHVSRAYWWIPVSVVSWSLAWYVSRFAGTVGFVGGSVVLGVVSVGGLQWLLRSPPAVR